MSKNCVARNCKNQAVGGDSYKTALCVKCKKETASNAPLYLTCKVCGESIFIQNKSSGIRIVCSQKCKVKRSAMLNKERYRREHPIKNTQCVLCKKKFTKEQLDTSEREFCSAKCYHSKRYQITKLAKHYKIKTELIKSRLKWK
jgi:hypothetical protein